MAAQAGLLVSMHWALTLSSEMCTSTAVGLLREPRTHWEVRNPSVDYRTMALILRCLDACHRCFRNLSSAAVCCSYVGLVCLSRFRPMVHFHYFLHLYTRRLSINAGISCAITSTYATSSHTRAAPLLTSDRQQQRGKYNCAKDFAHHNKQRFLLDQHSAYCVLSHA